MQSSSIQSSDQLSVLALVLLIVGFCAQTRAEEKPKLAQADVTPYVVSVEGVWRPDNPTKENALIEAVTSYTCFPHGGKEIVGSDAWCYTASAQAPLGILDVSKQLLKVVEWSCTQIIATDDSPVCLSSQTIFDLQSKTVIALDIKKTSSPGLAKVCKALPDRQTYYFQDKADYFTYKALHPR